MATTMTMMRCSCRTPKKKVQLTRRTARKRPGCGEIYLLFALIKSTTVLKSLADSPILHASLSLRSLKCAASLSGAPCCCSIDGLVALYRCTASDYCTLPVFTFLALSLSLASVASLPELPPANVEVVRPTALGLFACFNLPPPVATPESKLLRLRMLSSQSKLFGLKACPPTWNNRRRSQRHHPSNAYRPLDTTQWRPLLHSFYLENPSRSMSSTRRVPV